MRFWNDNAFQFGLCLLVLAAICAVFLFLSPPLQSELTAISGIIERIERKQAGRFRSPKMTIYVRTSAETIQINADPSIDTGDTLARGQMIDALVSYEDIVGRDIAFLYELRRGPEMLLRYGEKANIQTTQNEILGNLSPIFAVAGILICGLRWRKLR